MGQGGGGPPWTVGTAGWMVRVEKLAMRALVERGFGVEGSAGGGCGSEVMVIGVAVAAVVLGAMVVAVVLEAEDDDDG